ncbi:hypothetical protein HWV62_25948 [Athelia sp. TMB]|nr:hypothetical protein HWV62_25948 [Athelia sp. TMB]
MMSFFAYRIHILSQKWLITVVLWIGSFLIVVSETATLICQSGTVLSLEQNYAWLVTATQSLLAGVDVINTVALCCYLRFSRTGFTSVLNQIFLWTIQAGFVTTTAAIVTLGLSLALPNTALWICIALFQAKLYSNSLLASLNSRGFLQEELGKESMNDSHAVSAMFVSVMGDHTKQSDLDVESPGRNHAAQ